MLVRKVRGAMCIWEAHNEFSTVTVVDDDGADNDVIAELGWLSSLPGSVFRGVEVRVARAPGYADVADAAMIPDRMVSCHLFDGAARMWCDYTLKVDGTGLILLEDISLRPEETARLVQGLLEVGNYRKLALLGFPAAQNILAWLRDAEERHALLARRLAEGREDPAQLLAALAQISAEAEDMAAEARYRMSATFSYERMVQDRLCSLRESRIAGYATAAEFIERRLLPAMRTCAVADRRLTDLSHRIGRTAGLLGLEQNVLIGLHNRDILTALHDRARAQLRLQEVVERLSVFAIGYYLVGLFGHAVGFLPAAQKHSLLAAMTPFVLVGTWLTMRHLRKRMDGSTGDTA